MTHRPSVLATEFDRSDLPEQYMLSCNAASAPKGWTVESQGCWSLAYHPTLRVIRLRRRIELAGWLLGYPIDDEGRLVESELITPDVTPKSARWESWLYRFGGRYLAIAVDPASPRLYLDPVGSIPAVFSPSRRMVASTTTVIPRDQNERDREELVTAMGIPESNALYPVGLTPRHGITRVLPNHYLDLDRWQAIRHWPFNVITPDVTTESACETVARVTTRQIEALASKSQIQIALTAGVDSRMLLACARRQLDRVQFFTLDHPHRSVRIDVQVASRIAKRLGLNHRIIPYREPGTLERKRWLYRMGCEAGENTGWDFCEARRSLDPALPEIVGAVGELARGFYWRRDDGPDTPLETERLLRAVNAPRTPVTLRALLEWRGNLPTLDTLSTLDLFYLEQRMGCWGSVIALGDAGTTAARVFPLNHRDVITAMLGLPHPYRRAGQLPLDVIAAQWPELLSFPVNRASGLLRLQFQVEGIGTVVSKLARAVRNPRWALSRLFNSPSR